MGNRILARLGLGPAIFLFVLVWAVAALVCLTGTLFKAMNIDKRVKGITTDVGEIDGETDAVALVIETRKIAKEIQVAAAPLPGQLEVIQGSAASIENTAKEIEGKVNSIDATVTSIGGTAQAINETINSVHAKALSIEGKAKTIDSAVGTIGGFAAEINGTAKGILGNFSTILEVARTADGRLVATADKANAIFAIVESIRSDTANVMSVLGADWKVNGGNTIHGHANSIDCSDLVNRPVGVPAEPSTYCQR